MYNPLDLTGKRILVTGASAGIGRACAVMVSKLGAHVILVARRKDVLDETFGMMEGRDHQILPFDLSALEKMEELFQQATKDGSLYGLVHAAGLISAGPVHMLSPENIFRIMNLNYCSFVMLMKYFSKRKYCMGGSVVVVSSVSAEVGWAGGTLYSGSKGALSASVRSLALELVSKKIRVNAVVPSNIKTAMYDTLAGDLNTTEGIQKLLEKQPLGLGEVEDVAHAVCFLLSDASRFITGTNLVVDGGYLAQ